MKSFLCAVLLLSANLFGGQQLTFIPTFDNLLMDNSDNATVANTVYANSENAVGSNYTNTYSYMYVRAMSLIYFDLTDILGETVLSATLNLYPIGLVGDPSGAAARTDYKVNAIAQNWYPSLVTWNTAPSYTTVNEQIFEVPFTAAIPTMIDVTEIVKKWADTSWTNFGFMIQDAYYYAYVCNCLDATYFGSLDTGDATKIPKLIITIEGDPIPNPEIKALIPITNYLLMD